MSRAPAIRRGPGGAAINLSDRIYNIYDLIIVQQTNEYDSALKGLE